MLILAGPNESLAIEKEGFKIITMNLSTKDSTMIHY